MIKGLLIQSFIFKEMNILENTSYQGTFIIETKDLQTGEIKTEVVKNKIMDTVLSQLIGALQGNSPQS